MKKKFFFQESWFFFLSLLHFLIFCAQGKKNNNTSSSLRSLYPNDCDQRNKTRKKNILEDVALLTSKTLGRSGFSRAASL